MKDMNQVTLSIAQIVCPTEAEGPGRRMAVWVKGCSLRCVDCCNPEMLSTKGGTSMSVETLVDRANEAARGSRPIEGVTFLGGEPTEQAEGLSLLATRVREIGLSVMTFSGFTLAELRAKSDRHVDRLIDASDLLVDGRFAPQLPDSTRRWIGSSNQVMHFLSERYEQSDPQFESADTVEIRFGANGLTVNGWPEVADSIQTSIRAHERQAK